MSDKVESAALVGKWFHKFEEDDKLTRQGRVVSCVSDGVYLIQYYSWAMGNPSDQEIVPLREMLFDFKFYDDNCAMHYGYSNYCYRMMHKHPDQQEYWSRQADEALRASVGKPSPMSEAISKMGEDAAFDE